MVGRYLLLWLPMVPIAVANGAIRQLTYGTRVPELAAHQISSVTAIVLLGVYIRAVLPALHLASTRGAVLLGVLWLALTVAFELGFGHYVMGHPWQRLLHDYDLPHGRLWPLVLLWVAAAPTVFLRLHRHR